jgi:very-short-patch-repair endonuclease
MAFLPDKIREAAAEAIDEMILCFVAGLDVSVGSPIEGKLLLAIITHQFCETGKLPVMQRAGSWVGDGSWKILPQHQIGDYRVDFMIEYSNGNLKIVVECDGHDFHERTKEQAKNDRSRDRNLQAQGYLVLRYTGSEIWRDPWGCAVDIQSKVWERLTA